MQVAAMEKPAVGLYVLKPSKLKLIFVVTLGGIIVFGRAFGA